MISCRVLRSYLRMYVRMHTMAARKPYAIVVNWQNDPSADGLISPFQLLDEMRMLSGLLLRYPLTEVSYATAGNHVKIYQGVTLGAKSFKVDSDGNPIKDIKRHPDIGDNVVIYANATILGGDTKIGNNCVIGGNVWLTSSVSDNQTVYYQGK